MKESLRDKLDGNELDLSMSNLDSVPVKELALLPKATHLDLSCNQLTIIPDAFCTLTHLVKLDLSKNKLTELPQDFGRLESLQQLDLLDNRLKTLPRSFCQLRKLRWLDLKDNPELEDGLKRNAGDCLDEAQCRKCATRILMYMKDLDEQLEKQYLIKKQKKEKEEAKRKQKEERERQQKRLEKKAEKERRRREHEARRAQELLSQSGDTSDEEFNAVQEKLKTGSVKSKKDSRWSCLVLVFMSLLALAAALLVAVDFHCKSNQTDETCVHHWMPLRSQVISVAESIKISIVNFYHKHIESYLFK